MEVVGTILEIGEIQPVSEKFTKREVIVTVADNPSYPEHIKFELHQDKVFLADNFQVGQEVTVDFNLRGKPYTNKEGVTSYFNTLVIWRLA